MFWAWLCLGIFTRGALDIFTNAGKYRGYINRFCRKILRLRKSNFLGFAPFVPFWYFGCMAMYISHSVRYSYVDMITWGSYVIIAIDDYLNSDDDLHKRLRKAANKIKWKITQPKLIPKPE